MQCYRNGEDNENGKKTTTINFARAVHFFVHFFAVVLREYNLKLPETS